MTSPSKGNLFTSGSDQAQLAAGMTLDFMSAPKGGGIFSSENGRQLSYFGFIVHLRVSP